MLPEQQEAIEALLQRSKRSSVPLRRAFVQDRQRGGGPGPLAAFVTGRRRRALDLYLLVHALASKHPWDVELENVVWARLLGLSGTSAGSVVAKQWDWLETQGLVKVSRDGRRRRVTLLREDGTRLPYTHPGLPAGDPPDQRPAEGDYFHLPYVYWRAGMQDRADLPTKALLLIALSLGDDFLLPLDKAPRWYGLSKDSARNGIRGLLTYGIVAMRTRRKSTPLTPAGFTMERLYTPRPPWRTGNPPDLDA